MTLIKDTCRQIVEPNAEIASRTQRRLDQKTKPLRSLGRLEDLACQIAAIRDSENPSPPKKAIVVMAADHGVVEEGVSAYPQAVTGQMCLNFAAGGAAINILAKHAGSIVVVVDMGIKQALPDSDRILCRRVGAGTKNFTLGPAMTREEAVQAIEIGIAISQDLVSKGVTLVGLGEMGIGNTTASSALLSSLMQIPPEEVTGHGTGIELAAFGRKISAIKRGLAVNAPNPSDPIDVLAKVGGFEIAGLVGITLGCAANRVAVLMDGFIASVAAYIATRLESTVISYLIASHRSVEVGHSLILATLGKDPLFDLKMRLGEGTGAALAMGYIDASLRILEEMSTFDSAKVDQAERSTSSWECYSNQIYLC